MSLPTSLLWQLSDELSGLVARVLPSVVAICGSRDEAFGSGFLIDGDGHVVTNHHVVSGEDVLRVTRRDRPPQEARLLGSDAFTDLAVLKIDDPPEQPVTLRAAPVRLGELCFAVGSPLGILTESVTSGVVSGLARTIRHRKAARPIERGIQVDCAINPGNSGGPVFDAGGEVIGVATASAAQADNVSFVVSADTVRAIVPELIRDGKVRRASLGIGITPRSVEFSGRTIRRQAVTRVNEAADSAGLKVGDVLLSIEGTEVEGRAALYDHLGRESIGKPIALEVLREDKVVQLTVTATALDD
jgi:serine protease Do